MWGWYVLMISYVFEKVNILLTNLFKKIIIKKHTKYSYNTGNVLK